jgi:hypothetical protein
MRHESTITLNFMRKKIIGGLQTVNLGTGRSSLKWINQRLSLSKGCSSAEECREIFVGG